jgi:RNA recognition motif-containing protein
VLQRLKKLNISKNLLPAFYFNNLYGIDSLFLKIHGHVYNQSKVYLLNNCVTNLLSKTMNIYVSNIPFKASDSELKELFEEYGEVSSAKIIMDKVSQRSRGFGFVEMPDDASARQAMQELNGSSFLGKELAVNEARPKTDDSRGGNRGGGGGFNRGGGGNSGGFNRRGY